MAPLPEIARIEIEKYAVDGLNFESILTVSPNGRVITVVDFAREPDGRPYTATSIIARIEENHIVIDHDDNDKPLVDALVAAGIPRERIILTYAGEELP
jgi:hypothetical protein